MQKHMQLRAGGRPHGGQKVQPPRVNAHTGDRMCRPARVGSRTSDIMCRPTRLGAHTSDIHTVPPQRVGAYTVTESDRKLH